MGTQSKYHFHLIWSPPPIRALWLTWWTFALVRHERRLSASAAVLARRRRAGNVLGLAVLSRVSWFAVASVKGSKSQVSAISCIDRSNIPLVPHLLVRSVRVDALATVVTGALYALLDILLASLALEADRTVALELATAHRLTRASVLAWGRRTDILLLAVPARVSRDTRALILVQRLQHAVAVVFARRRIAGRLLGDLAEWGGEPDRALAHETRRSIVLDHWGARAPVLAPLAGPRLAGIGQFAVVADKARRATNGRQAIG